MLTCTLAGHDGPGADVDSMGASDTVYDPFIASGIEAKFTAMWTFGAVAVAPDVLGFLAGG